MSHQHAICLLVTSSPFFVFSLAESFLWPSWRNVSYWTVDILIYLAIPAIVLVIASKKCALSARSIGLLSMPSRFDVPRFVWICVVCTILVLFVAIFTVSLTRTLVAEYPHLLAQRYTEPISSELSYRALIIAYLVLTASIVEEVFFRGILRKIVFDLVPYGRRLAFVVMSTALFGAFHWKLGFVPFVTALSLGVLLALLFLELSDLRPLIVAHAFLNLYWYW